MAEYVITSIYVYGDEEEIERFRARIRGKRKAIDFDSVVPMPESVCTAEIGSREFRDAHGNNWFRWRRDNWGMVGNAEADIWLGNRLQFYTQYRSPRKIYEGLAKVSEDLDIEMEGWWASENIRDTTGSFWIENGRITVCESTELRAMLDDYENAWGTEYMPE